MKNTFQKCNPLDLCELSNKIWCNIIFVSVFFAIKPCQFLDIRYCILQAMKHFLRCDGENSQAIELAIETVGRANDDQLTHELVNFLMGDTDGVPKVRDYSLYNFLLLFLSKDGFSISFQPLFG